jgi:hypothetical protein
MLLIPPSPPHCLPSALMIAPLHFDLPRGLEPARVQVHPR